MLRPENGPLINVVGMFPARALYEQWNLTVHQEIVPLLQLDFKESQLLLELSLDISQWIHSYRSVSECLERLPGEIRAYMQPLKVKRWTEQPRSLLEWK